MTPPASSRAALALVVVTWLVFTAWSFTIVAAQGLFGFLYVAAREPWSAQVLVDLGIMIVLYCVWLVRDARERGLSPWPWAVLALTWGSIGVLPYFVYRAWRARGSAQRT